MLFLHLVVEPIIVLTLSFEITLGCLCERTPCDTGDVACAGSTAYNPLNFVNDLGAEMNQLGQIF
ncbi:MAG: hypothetical protein BWY75_02507 [bacterium ADurb.Bin425]|nr:MAG: hypothetical protein BWY75_02507 [bacterium ADurb.Bin425]